MSISAIVILSAASGGMAWAAITLTATWWFNRRARQLSEARASEVARMKAAILGGR